jgi:hypothetical protein
VGLVRDSSVQSLTVLYASGLLPTVVSTQRQNILKGWTKHEQRHGDPPESNPVVRRERIGDKSAAGDGDGGMQRITPWGMKCFSVGEIVREGRLRSAGVLLARCYLNHVQLDGRFGKCTGFFVDRDRHGKPQSQHILCIPPLPGTQARDPTVSESQADDRILIWIYGSCWHQRHDQVLALGSLRPVTSLDEGPSHPSAVWRAVKKVRETWSVVECPTQWPLESLA